MKILMLTDSLGFGGVETHVETLALELQKAGHEVIVASFGGATAQKLKKEGIKHLKLPPPPRKETKFCAQKSPIEIKFAHLSQMAVARGLIGEYFDKELPDIVHAHTRRTAFLAQNLCRARKIPLIVTAHAKFSMDFPKNVLSRWGDFTICVSQDIKNYLVSHLQVAENGAKVIFNGVKNKKTVIPSKRTSHKLIFVSRLDSDCSLGAYLLCQIAPRLAGLYPDLKVKIIGGGGEYAKISKIACEANQKLNQQLIKIFGNVSDPASIFEGDELFVGVSRAALEAMACGLPVILLGNEGFLGLLDEEKIPLAAQSNFTCRIPCINDVDFGVKGDAFSRLQDQLFEEIVRYFELSDEKKEELSLLSQRVVAKHYGAEMMANKTLSVYKKCLKRTQKMAICGYYGHGNFGDEVVLSVILDSIDRSRFTTSIVKGKNPYAILKSLVNSDFFVFGGGSLLQNTTSDLSLIYYLALIKIAHLFCRRSLMLSNGIGPIENSTFSRATWLNAIARALNSFDVISVRDCNSRLLLQKALPRKTIYLLPDPAISLFAVENQSQNDSQTCQVAPTTALKTAPTTPQKAVPTTPQKAAPKIDHQAPIVFIPCSHELKKHEIDLRSLANELKKLSLYLKSPLLVAILNPHEDGETARILSRLSGAKTVTPRNTEEMNSLLYGAKIVLTQRYHGAVFAIGNHVPTLVLSSDPKMQSFCLENKLFSAISPSRSRIAGGKRGVLELNNLALSAINHYKNHNFEIQSAFLRQAELTKKLLPKFLD